MAKRWGVLFALRPTGIMKATVLRASTARAISAPKFAVVQAHAPRGSVRKVVSTQAPAPPAVRGLYGVAIANRGLPICRQRQSGLSVLRWARRRQMIWRRQLLVGFIACLGAPGFSAERDCRDSDDCVSGGERCLAPG